MKIKTQFIVSLLLTIVFIIVFFYFKTDLYKICNSTLCRAFVDYSALILFIGPATIVQLFIIFYKKSEKLTIFWNKYSKIYLFVYVLVYALVPMKDTSLFSFQKDLALILSSAIFFLLSLCSLLYKIHKSK